MSYLVLARKYRPQRFEDVVAQEHITKTLQNAIRQKRFSHAYLFTGTRGTGKTTTARVLAKALNCEQGPTPEPCNECLNCQQITASSSLDVIEIDAASHTGVDDVRDLRDNARYTPAAGNYKIYIIDEVHRLSANAFDALLKTLEEPPAHVIFIFATTEPQKLPATILSRCQRYDFRRVPFSELTAYLGKLAQMEEIEIDEDALALIAQKGDGSMRDSLSIFEQVIAVAEGRISRKLIAESLGLVDLDLIFELTSCVLEKDVNKTLDLIERMITGGIDINQFIEDMQEHFRKLLIVNTAQKATDYLAVSDYFQKKYMALKDSFTDNDIFRVIRMLSELRADLKAGADPALYFEVAMLRLVKMESSVTLEQVLDKLGQLTSGESTASSGSASFKSDSDSNSQQVSRAGQIKPKPSAHAKDNLSSGSSRQASANPDEPASPQSSAGAVPVEVRPATWIDFIGRVKADQRILGEMLGSGELTRLSEKEAELTFAANGTSYPQIFERMEHRRILEQHMESVFGRKLNLKFKVDRNKAPSGGDDRNGANDISAEELLERKPELKKIVDKIGGEVKSVKVNRRNKGDGNG
jgi:DNA polymerase-3 subunit gamma/tau